MIITADPQTEVCATPERPQKTNSEISLTHFVTAITIKLDCVASSFTRCAAVLAVWRLRACARGILAFLFFSHDFLPGFLTKNGFNNGAQSLAQSRDHGYKRKEIGTRIELRGRQCDGLPTRATASSTFADSHIPPITSPAH